MEMMMASSTQLHSTRPIYDRWVIMESQRWMALIVTGVVALTLATELLLPLNISAVRAIAGAGVALMLVVALLMDRPLTGRSLRSIRPRLKERCESLYGVDLSDADYVGVSSCAESGYAVGNSSFDIGFLVFEPGAMRYFGDRIAFTLRSDQIIAAKPIPAGVQGGLLFRSVVVKWMENKYSNPNQFSILTFEAVSKKDLETCASVLIQKIEERKQQTAPIPKIISSPPAFNAIQKAFPRLYLAYWSWYWGLQGPVRLLLFPHRYYGDKWLLIVMSASGLLCLAYEWIRHGIELMLHGIRMRRARSVS
jgi:hypothetical protein